MARLQLVGWFAQLRILQDVGCAEDSDEVRSSVFRRTWPPGGLEVPQHGEGWLSLLDLLPRARRAVAVQGAGVDRFGRPVGAHRFDMAGLRWGDDTI